MKRRSDQVPQADRSEDPRLRRLIREAAYEGRPNDEFKRRLRRELEHNFRYHRPRRLRTAFVLAAAVVVGVVGLRVTDVGSDNFELKDTHRSVKGGGELYVRPFSGQRVGGAVGQGDSVVSMDKETLEQVMDAEAAGLGTPVFLDGWTIAGCTELSAGMRVEVDGESHDTSQTIKDMDPAAFPIMRRFAQEQMKAFEDAIERGSVPVSDVEVRTVLGRRMLVKKWTADVPGYGPVTRWYGEPVDEP